MVKHSTADMRAHLAGVVPGSLIAPTERCRSARLSRQAGDIGGVVGESRTQTDNLVVLRGQLRYRLDPEGGVFGDYDG